MAYSLHYDAVADFGFTFYLDLLYTNVLFGF